MLMTILGVKCVDGNPKWTKIDTNQMLIFDCCCKHEDLKYRFGSSLDHCETFFFNRNNCNKKKEKKKINSFNQLLYSNNCYLKPQNIDHDTMHNWWLLVKFHLLQICWSRAQPRHQAGVAVLNVSGEQEMVVSMETVNLSEGDCRRSCVGSSDDFPCATLFFFFFNIKKSHCAVNIQHVSRQRQSVKAAWRQERQTGSESGGTPPAVAASRNFFHLPATTKYRLRLKFSFFSFFF